MSFTNFSVEIDGDGIAVVTWDEPGRSMNVIDGAVMDELSAIVEQTTAADDDPACLAVGQHEPVFGFKSFVGRAGPIESLMHGVSFIRMHA